MEDVRVVSATDQVVELEVSLSWNNSWRRASNWDAVYLFGKYKFRGASDWHHLYFTTTASDHTSDAATEQLPVNGGRGLLVRRSADGSGSMYATLRLKANLQGNVRLPLMASAITSGDLFFSVQGIEMVLIPLAPFYAGDRNVSGAFSDASFGMILPEYDLINTVSGYTYSSNGSESANASRTADRHKQGVYDASARLDWCGTAIPAIWQVDFKTAKKILYFGVSGVSALNWSGFPPAPAGDWFLEGSENNSTWTELWCGGPEYWGQSAVSYPVRAIRVSHPGSYRYYRIRVADNQCSALWNNIRINNIGMTEEELSEISDDAFPVRITYENSVFPASYPSGFHSFYAMKYELSQEQYVTFLNMLPRSAQYGRTLGGLLDGLEEGEYIFGDRRDTPSFRNGIVLKRKYPNTELPYVFAHDLTETDLNNSDKDGQAIACNYLSPSDMLAYADWSGLRPLSELEYEKMCRGSFPEEPEAGSFAWERGGVEPLTDVVHEGESKEALLPGSTANANLDGGTNPVDAPVRVGLFTRPGNRQQAGLSYWGVSELTGNLSEIYCNTGVYGRQQNRTIHGGGQLNADGSHLVSGTDWPCEKEAYGVRGSDYSTPVSEASAFDRRRAEDYFTGIDERLPTTGVRLGFSTEPVRIVTQLTLENGLRSSSALVSDTICAPLAYCIKGDKHGAPEFPAEYLWYESTDDGASWQLLTEGGCDLVLRNLTDRISENTIRCFRYKRISVKLEDMSETGAVCLVVAHGYSVNRFSDTIRPCMLSNGFQITVPLPSTFEWRCVESGKRLASFSTSFASSYAVQVDDLKTDPAEFPSGNYSFHVNIFMAGKCVSDLSLQVDAIPETISPFKSPADVSYVYETNNTLTVNDNWGGPDLQQWNIVGGNYGNLTVSAVGVLSGVSTTFLRVEVEAVCRDFPDRVYRKKWLEALRTLSYTGDVQQMALPRGIYLLECWGAQGGIMESGWTGIGGYGGYTKGKLNLETWRMFSVYVGGLGQGYNSGRSTHFGGWNGGADCYGGASGGGGATDIRVTGGAWSDASSLRSRIMVAGGGGGSNDNQNGGSGGGLTGGTGACSGGSAAAGGTQTGGGSGWIAGSFGAGGGSPNNYNDGGAGGGGYYGGGKSNGNACAGAGGSSFISGFAGCNAVNASGGHTGQPNHFSGLIFTEASMSAGQRTGSGMVRITFQ
jgi:hypothetical protein